MLTPVAKRWFALVAGVAVVGLALVVVSFPCGAPRLEIINQSPADFGAVYSLVLTNSSRMTLQVGPAVKWVEGPSWRPGDAGATTCLSSNTVWFRKASGQSAEESTLLPGEYGYVHVPVASEVDRFRVTVVCFSEGDVAMKLRSRAASWAFRHGPAWLSRRWLFRQAGFDGRRQHIVETPWVPNHRRPLSAGGAVPFSRHAAETTSHPA